MILVMKYSRPSWYQTQNLDSRAIHEHAELKRNFTRQGKRPTMSLGRLETVMSGLTDFFF
jgi:hypothetical protein